jgi:hypothetical protein
MLAVLLNVPEAGSYSSALDAELALGVTDPPAIKTLPSVSSVAVWPRRGTLVGPAAVKVPCAMHIWPAHGKITVFMP